MKRLRWGCGLIGLVLLGGCGGSAASRRGQGDGAGGGAGGEVEVSGGTSVGGATALGGAFSAGGPTVGGTFGAGSGSGGRMTNDAGAGGQASGRLPLPPGCDARAREVTDVSCSLSAYCSVQSQITHCTPLSSGRWQCRCEQRPGRTYEIEGAPGMQACAVAVGACGAKDSELAEETCEARTDDSQDESCGLVLACSREVDVGFAPDARAWLVREGWAQCSVSAAGESFGCQCGDDEAKKEYELFVDSAVSACRPLLDFCMSAAEPELSGPERCVLGSATSSSDGCERLEYCSKLMRLTDDVELGELEPRAGSCSPRAGGGSECYCSTPNAASNILQLNAAPSNPTCALVASICADGVELVPTAAASCEVTSQTAFGTSCEGDLSCHQAATVAGQALVAEGRLLVRCARNEAAQPWQCSCASDQKAAIFELGAAQASAWEACSQAPHACLQHLDVHLGVYGDFLYPPDPLSP